MQKLFLMAAIAIALPIIAQAQEITPRTEIFVGYSYMRLDQNSQLTNQDRDLNGYNVEGTVTLYKKWLGVTVDASGNFGDLQENFFPQTNQGITLLMAGPQITYRRFKQFQPFARFLIGAGRQRLDNLATNFSQTNYDYAFAAGGGIDIRTPFSDRLAIRAFQADYVRTNFLGVKANNLRASTGIILRFGNVSPR